MSTLLIIGISNRGTVHSSLHLWETPIRCCQFCDMKLCRLPSYTPSQYATLLPNPFISLVHIMMYIVYIRISDQTTAQPLCEAYRFKTGKEGGQEGLTAERSDLFDQRSKLAGSDHQRRPGLCLWSNWAQVLCCFFCYDHSAGIFPAQVVIAIQGQISHSIRHWPHLLWKSQWIALIHHNDAIGRVHSGMGTYIFSEMPYNCSTILRF